MSPARDEVSIDGKNHGRLPRVAVERRKTENSKNGLKVGVTTGADRLAADDSCLKIRCGMSTSVTPVFPRSGCAGSVIVRNSLVRETRKSGIDGSASKYAPFGHATQK
jgi:hypothetical protein